MKINFTKKKESVEVVETKSSIVNESSEAFETFEKASLEELQKARNAINTIKKQNSIQALFSSGKNAKLLASNQEILMGVMKNTLDWLAVVTSAEVVRKDEYDTLTSQLLQLDEDVTEQLDSQIKFKKAYQNMMKQQDKQIQYMMETDRMKKENFYLKIISASSIVLALISVIISAL